MWVRRTLLPSILFFASACAAQPVPVPESAPTPAPLSPVSFDSAPYAWLKNMAPLPPITSLEYHVAPPSRSTRVPVTEASFGSWLRSLPVRPDSQEVHSYSGQTIRAPAAAVVVLDLGRGDLQQCADTVLRLHAEYLWASGRASDATYHFTSGDRSSFVDWVAGERFQPAGRGIRRVMTSSGTADHSTYRAWLQHLFIYAGTRSLASDSRSLADSEAIEPGDFFVDPGSPGHAVVVLDVALTDDGRRLGLIGQGFTPAQDLHLVEWRDAVWLPLPSSSGDRLQTPSWRPFARSSVRRFLSLD